jgi:hypothetical protein
MTLFGKILLNSVDTKLLDLIPSAKVPTLFMSNALNSQKVYLYKKGLRHPIDTLETFNHYNFNFEKVLKVPPELVDMLEIGDIVNSTYIPE